MRNLEIMLYENDEYINESVFLEGIVIMSWVLQSLARLRKDQTTENIWTRFDKVVRDLSNVVRKTERNTLSGLIF